LLGTSRFVDGLLNISKGIYKACYVDLLKFYFGLILAYTKTKKAKIRFFTVVPAFQLSWVLRLPTLKTKEIK
jgi:hypothetical protein